MLVKNDNKLESEIATIEVARNLMVFVISKDVTRISNVRIIITRLEGETIVEENEVATWVDLSRDTATLSVDAQGYLPVEKSIELEQRFNGALISMERDLFRLIPSEVYLPGENLLYLEDFQCGMVKGWPEIEISTQGWRIGPNPDEPDNIVISVSGKGEDGELILTSYL